MHLKLWEILFDHKSYFSFTLVFELFFPLFISVIHREAFFSHYFAVCLPLCLCPATTIECQNETKYEFEKKKTIYLRWNEVFNKAIALQERYTVPLYTSLFRVYMHPIGRITRVTSQELRWWLVDIYQLSLSPNKTKCGIQAIQEPNDMNETSRPGFRSVKKSYFLRNVTHSRCP